MSFRPLQEEERTTVLKQIESVKAGIRLSESYLAGLQKKLKEGVWQYDIDHSLPMPKPDCYLCVSRIAILNKCGKGKKYGQVCDEYLHFTGRPAPEQVKEVK